MLRDPEDDLDADTERINKSGLPQSPSGLPCHLQRGRPPHRGLAL
jgi:hypothetical protein